MREKAGVMNDPHVSSLGDEWTAMTPKEDLSSPLCVIPIPRTPAPLWFLWEPP